MPAVEKKEVVLRSVYSEDFRDPEWRGANEREWCAHAINRRTDWLPVIGLTDFDRVELEHQVGRARSLGMPRFDAVGWIGDRAYIIEAKVKCTAVEMLAGAAQLLYYRSVARNMGWDVAGLFLLSPAWPPLFAETIVTEGFDLTAIRLTPDAFTAIVGARK